MNREELLRDIKNNPDKHRHGDLNGISRCSMVDGKLDTEVFEAHEKYASYGTNGGVRCDVASGPCSCGAWH
jgi:hypothetical protein